MNNSVVHNQNILLSYYRIRQLIGFLGILLPILVVYFYGGMLSSISHYYYTKSAVFFIIILSSFSLLLISYKGYPIDKKTEKISDNFLTHIAGISALMVVLIPTDCTGLVNSDICNVSHYQLYGHNNNLLGTIHLIFAALFLLIMGYMSIFRFTKGKHKLNNILYLVCGILVWGSVLTIGIEILLYEIFDIEYFSVYMVIIMETIAIWSFGISWLVKGRALRDITNGLEKLKTKLVD